MPPSPLVPRAARPVREQWRALAEERGSGERFAPALAERLPRAARRWITHAVAEGTPLARSVRLDMSGQIRLGSWRQFSAVQLLVPATGFIWAATTRIGRYRYRVTTGSPGSGEMRWRTGGIIPVVSAHGRDVGDSAAGRLAGESIFVPTAFSLAQWAGDEDVASATWTVAGHEDTVHLDVAENGALRGLRMQRWGNPNGGTFARHPFTVTVDAERNFGGITIASRIRAEWGTGDGSDGEFFRAEISDAHFF